MIGSSADTWVAKVRALGARDVYVARSLDAVSIAASSTLAAAARPIITA